MDIKKITVHFNFVDNSDWEHAASLKGWLKADDLLVFVAARKESQSYQKGFEGLQAKLERYFGSVTKILVYPQVNPYSYNGAATGIAVE